MSSNSNSDGGPGQREIAYRLFAAEYDDATLDHSESDEERAPNYVVTPTGARANRLFAVGVLTEVESVNEDVLRARVADPTGAFVAYAGQYQPDAVAFLENTETPEFVALAGKARTFQPEDSDRIYTSVRPESVNAVDAGTRDRWVVSAAEATLRRVATFADALAMDERGEELRDALTARGVDPSLASGISLAIDHYGTTTAYLEAVRRLAVDALEVVAGDRDQVRSLDLAPDEGGEAELGPLPEDASGVTAGTASPATAEAESEAAAETTASAETEPATEPEPETAGASAEGGGEAVEETAAATQMEEMAETEPTDAETDTAEAEASETESAGGASADPAGTADESPAGESATAGSSEPAESGAASGGLGDFEDVDGSDEGTAASAESDETAAGAAAAEPADSGASGEESPAGVDEAEMYEFDEEERQEIEEEFGTDFSTGTEVDAPGEADIETPGEAGGDAAGGDEAGAAVEETAAATQAEEMAETEPADATTADEADEADEAASETADDAAGADDPAEDVDLETAVVDAMDDIDEGDGADREAVVAAVVDEYGVDPGDAADAIDDALMNGQCYEPAEGRLKAI